jgi:PEP-CTERM motif
VVMRCFMTWSVRGVIIAALWSGGTGWADAGVLYDQPASSPGGLASQNAPNVFGPLYTAFDDFTLTTGALVSGVQWQGAYYNPPTQGTITQFELIFWSDNAGLPGTALRTYDISGNAGETFAGSSGDFLDYNYAANLSTPFQVDANTKYWLSIQPTVDFPPQWLWRYGTGGDGQSAQIILSVSPNPSPVLQDLAFSLTGISVPEPSTLVMGGIGTSIVLVARRRSHRRRDRG